mmetsp:Transcript_17305/g.35274  ORF Transcript_17305/g.35274 Transcript_17305/m.35274 type:complete len:235 (+) Transcript_17305:243-947(+)
MALAQRQDEDEGGSAAAAGEEAGGGVSQRSLDLVECLAQNGAHINAQDTLGRTAMHYAADDARGQRLMTWLVGRKAKTDISDSLGRTPADVAMIRGNEVGALAALEIDDGGGVGGGGGGDDGATSSSSSSAAVPERKDSESSSGGSADNIASKRRQTNFTRMVSQRVEAEGQEEGAATTTAAGGSRATATAALLSLPAPWQSFTDMSSGDPYYFNPLTGATSWTSPREEFSTSM